MAFKTDGRSMRDKASKSSRPRLAQSTARQGKRIPPADGSARDARARPVSKTMPYGTPKLLANVQTTQQIEVQLRVLAFHIVQ